MAVKSNQGNQQFVNKSWPESETTLLTKFFMH